MAAFQHQKGTYRKSGEGLFRRACNTTGQWEMVINWKRVDLDYILEILYCEGGETLEQVAQ